MLKSRPCPPPTCRWARAPPPPPPQLLAQAAAGGSSSLPEARSPSWAFGHGPPTTAGGWPNGPAMWRPRQPLRERETAVNRITMPSLASLGAPPPPRLSGPTVSSPERSTISSHRSIPLERTRGNVLILIFPSHHS